MSNNRQGGKPTDRTTTNEIYFSDDGARWLMKWLAGNKLLCPDCIWNVMDACCGSIRQPLSQAWYEIDPQRRTTQLDCIDINLINPFEHGNNSEGDILDFPYHQNKKYSMIFCNPPWSPVEKAEEIYHYLLQFLGMNGILYFVINYAFLNTNWQRMGRLGHGISIPLPRYTFALSQKENDPDSNGLLDPWLMINRQRLDDPPFGIPIPPEICKSGQKLLPLE